MKILVIQQKMIGDVLTSTILFEELRHIYPEAELHYLINSHTKPVVEHNPNIDKFVLYTPEIESSRLEFYRFLKTIKGEQYDIVLDVYSKLSSNFISWFSGAKTKISYYKHYTQFIYTHPIKRLAFYRTNAGLAIENRLELLKPLSQEVYTNAKPKIYLTESEKETAKNRLISNGVDLNKSVFMISVLGSGIKKTYPAEYMAQVIDEIATTTDATLLFNYIPKQHAEAKAIYNLCKPETQKRINFELFGENLRAFLAILSQCEAIIGNEGGAINMAKALNIRTFSIFSPWIDKSTWSIFEDDINNVSVHLKDYESELYANKKEKELKGQALEFYTKFKPSFFTDTLTRFLKKQAIELHQDSSQTKLTALIITHNEIIHIEEMIRNLAFAHEIIVVDSFSTDGTYEKLQSFSHVKIVQHEFKNFTEQKNFALTLPTNDWVLFIDADERVSPAFKDDVISKINSDSDIVAYNSLFRYYFGHTPIRFSGFQTAKSYRLFRKSKCHYDTTKSVHEDLIVDGKSGLMKHRLVHYSFRDYDHYKEKMEHYALLKAEQSFKKGQRSNLFKKTFKPVYRFFNHYIMRLGILDGKVGYIISKLNAYGVKKRYQELDRLNELASK